MLGRGNPNAKTKTLASGSRFRQGDSTPGDTINLRRSAIPTPALQLLQTHPGPGGRCSVDGRTPPPRDLTRLSNVSSPLQLRPGQTQHLVTAGPGQLVELLVRLVRLIICSQRRGEAPLHVGFRAVGGLDFLRVQNVRSESIRSY